MSPTLLVLFCFLSQSSGSPQPSPRAESEPYYIAILKTVYMWDNFEGTYINNIFTIFWCHFRTAKEKHWGKSKYRHYKRIFCLWGRLDRVWSHRKVLQNDHQQKLLDQCLVSLLRWDCHPGQHSWPDHKWLPDNPLSILICLGRRLQEFWWTLGLVRWKSDELYKLGSGPAQ